MVQQLFNRTPLLSGDNTAEKKEEIRSYFHATLDRTELLFETLVGDESYFKKSIPLRHPLIFYLGHTSTFFINKLLISGLVKERINPKMESMFAVGVDEMSWDDLTLSDYDWPSISEVWAYRKSMRKIVDQLLTETELTLPINWDNPWWIVLMG
ncbi:MAG: SAM-dependent methyltransferase, partial [Candidatus Marinimicrobia bacterium]|nr:SAM-dependent methyltransferase [Candidatus Neomarinimicrobiota bacterium]